MRLLVLFLCLLTSLVSQLVLALHGAEEFSQHEEVWPLVRHVQHKRHAPDVMQYNGGHPQEIEVTIDVKGQTMILELQQSRLLVSNTYFERHQHDNGSHVVHTPSKQDVEVCQYRGHVRGVQDSWAAISTCAGVSGVVFDGHELLHIQPANVHSDAHLLFRHKNHSAVNWTCGSHDDFQHMFTQRKKREILSAYKSDKQAHYIEMVLVVDQAAYQKLGGRRELVARRCKNLVNILNAVVSQLHILVVLVGVVMWSHRDEIVSPSTKTYHSFLEYRANELMKQHPNDNAQLLVGQQVEIGVVGRAPVSAICSRKNSGAVIVVHSDLDVFVALTMAHELGHNLGMNHDTYDCKCPQSSCIMAEALTQESQTKWSSCSEKSVAITLSSVLAACLRNLPQSVFEGSDCGNGLLEQGEECDCGPLDFCDTSCCDARTCRLTVNATCATGPCCDTNTCQFRRGGSECRVVSDECDLPEFCSGDSELCPKDWHKADGENCDNEQAFCYDGLCGSLRSHCRKLWGPGSEPSDPRCYDLNVRGNVGGNCGQDFFTDRFQKCEKENVRCGRIHCTREDTMPKAGYETVSVQIHGNVMCHVANLHVTPRDAGLVPNGVACGNNMICQHQHCVSVASVQPEVNCSAQCNTRGVCNNAGHCHCNDGYGPPYCSGPGFGGSVDSGPTYDPNSNSLLAGLVIFAISVSVTALGLLLLVWYMKRPNNVISGTTKTISNNGYIASVPRRPHGDPTNESKPRFNMNRLSNTTMFSIFRPSQPTVERPIRPSRSPPKPPTSLPASKNKLLPGPSKAMKTEETTAKVKSDTSAITISSQMKKSSATKTNKKTAPASVKSDTSITISSSHDVPTVQFKSKNLKSTSKAKENFFSQPSASSNQKSTTKIEMPRVQSKSVSKLAKQFEANK